MVKTEPMDVMRSIGINCDEELIQALDELAVIMAEDGIVPSRSEIARTLLWSGIAIIRSRNPQVGALLKAAANAEAAGGA